MRKSLIWLGATAALLVAGCSSNDMAGMDHGSSTAAPTSARGQQVDHNQQDVTFAQDMIVHHQQALDMAKMVPATGSNPKVPDLAKRIEAAQDPEIKKMTEWLGKWGSVPSSSMPGMDHGSSGHGSSDHGSTSGMMTAEEMAKLQQAKGSEFDRMWTDMMIRHHEGAVAMAKTELEKGGNADAKKLAQDIITAQEREISEMRDMLKSI